MTWVRSALWVPLAAVLFLLACPSESPALSATEITGTWTGTWTSRVYANTTGTVTLILSGTDSPVIPNLTGTITMTGPGKPTIAQLPIRQGWIVGNDGFYAEAIPPGEVYPCFVDLGAFAPDIAPTRIAGSYHINTFCLPSIVDAGVFEIRKVAAAPALTLSLNQNAFRSRDTLRVGLRAQNPGVPINADFYFGVFLPDGVTVLFVISLSPLNGVVTRLDVDPRTFRPLLANVQLAQGLDVTLTDFFVYTFAGGETPGTYSVFAALTLPGAFNDGRVDPGDVLVLDARPFSFSP